MIRRGINSCGRHTVANITFSDAPRGQPHLRRRPARVPTEPANRLAGRHTAPIYKHIFPDQAEIRPETKQSRPTNRPACGVAPEPQLFHVPPGAPKWANTTTNTNTTHTWLGHQHAVRSNNNNNNHKRKPTLPAKPLSPMTFLARPEPRPGWLAPMAG
jgi:hypothetical protein